MASPYSMHHLAFLKSSLDRMMLWMTLFNNFLLYEGQNTFPLIYTVATTETHAFVARRLVAGTTSPQPCLRRRRLKRKKTLPLKYKLAA